MQQTEKYGFNLIEMKDTFSPDALNENVRRLEKVFDDKEIRYDSFEGDNSNDRDFGLGFYPKLVVLLGLAYGNPSICMISRGNAVYVSASAASVTELVEMAETGFHINSKSMFNGTTRITWYIAFP